MLGLFRKKSSSLLGIDINATAITVLALSRQGAGYRVEAFAREPLLPGVVQGRQIVDPESLGMALLRAWSRSGSRLRDSVVAVPGEALISKLIEVPAGLSDEELENQIALEASQYIPYALEDVALDFEVQGPVPGNSRRVQVLLVACRNEQVESLEAVLALAGLRARVVDSEPLALERGLALTIAKALPQASLALLDLGADISTFSVMRGQRVIYGREQLFGSRQLMEALGRHHGLTLDEALLAQRKGCLPQGCNEDVLQPFGLQVQEQVVLALQQFSASAQQQPLDLLLLAGTASALDGLARAVEQCSGVATAIADPVRNMSVSHRLDSQQLAGQAPGLLLACGLALRGLY
ncbi:MULTISPECIES: type IV pilus assembly protein PilM [unclassified Pseudomonas]|uniref:type IV pilus assembly protein PilM n=1 Tax=unclassified Pseudomonas TaxID=196821 RepID=UPI0008382E34|nr:MULTISPECIES: type IV pilus assembly protein PilM [unclassified Pseudomonas]QIH05774.1 type IV pilus assembly protein PilM [Pseudomonas sp. BIOMIG1BAC]